MADRGNASHGVRYLCISTAKSLMRNAIDSKETPAP
jgi:hypothetical protein